MMMGVINHRFIYEGIDEKEMLEKYAIIAELDVVGHDENGRVGMGAWGI